MQSAETKKEVSIYINKQKMVSEIRPRQTRKKTGANSATRRPYYLSIDSKNNVAARPLIAQYQNSYSISASSDAATCLGRFRNLTPIGFVSVKTVRLLRPRFVGARPFFPIPLFASSPRREAAPESSGNRHQALSFAIVDEM